VLTPKELYLAIVQTHAPSTMDDAHGVDEDSAIRYVLDCSCGLVQVIEIDVTTAGLQGVVDEEASRSEAQSYKARKALAVQFIHGSVREHLLQHTDLLADDRSGTMSQADVCHTEIAGACLRYILSLSEQVLETGKRAPRRALARYAAKHWSEHLRMCSRPRNRELCDLACNLLQYNTTALLAWLQLCDVEQASPDWELTAADLAPPLYYAATTGVSEVVSSMILPGVDVDATGGRYGSALQAASAGGHVEVVEVLLDAGAQIDAGNGNALHTAINNGNETVFMRARSKRLAHRVRHQYRYEGST